MKMGMTFTKICEWCAFAARGSIWPKDYQKGWLEEESATEQEEHKKHPNKGRPGNYTCNRLKVTLMALTGWLDIENMKALWPATKTQNKTD